MKSEKRSISRFGWLPLVGYMLAALLLGGCGDASLTTSAGESGGGMIVGGVGVGGTGVVSASAAGTAAPETYINAVVFLDKNNNAAVDPDEPTAVTDANGSYSLAASAADLAAYPLRMQLTEGQTIAASTGLVVSASAVVDMNTP
jgi:hypothetical protein